MHELHLEPPFEALWKDREPFIEVEKLQGVVFRELEARRTLRTEIEGRGYFVKIHRGVGWREIWKNLVYLRLPVISARNEWEVIQRLHKLGIPTMRAVAYGIQGRNPASVRSFIITEDLGHTISLEDFTRNWVADPPPVSLKRALLERVADIAGKMHQGGINHRDFYLCHFLLHTDQTFQNDQLKISLIDLHRAQLRSRVPRRWRNKDLAGLYFSALDAGLTKRDRLRFLKWYFGVPLRMIMAQEAGTLLALEKKAARLRSRYQRKYAPYLKDGDL